MEKNKELTPMMELKNRLFDVRINQNPITLEEMNGYIKKEKQVIEDAFYSAVKITGEGWNGEYAGSNYPCIEEDFKDNFNDYYNTKYKNYEI